MTTGRLICAHSKNPDRWWFGVDGSATEVVQTVECARGRRTMNNLTAFVTLMDAISVASERVIEILRGKIPPLAKNREGDAEGFRRTAMHILTRNCDEEKQIVRATRHRPENVRNRARLVPGKSREPDSGPGVLVISKAHREIPWPKT